MELIDRIFEACIEEFRVNGVKFTMDDLAHRVGISKRTLYETIPSKKKVMELAIDKTFADVKRQQKEILDNQELSTISKIKRMFMITPIYAGVLDYRRMDEVKANYPILYRKIEAGIENDWEPTLKLLEKAMEEGVIRPTNLILLRLLLVDIFEQLINGRVLIDNNISYEKAIEETISIIFNGILIRE